jgi:hypothetical protein
VIGAMLGSVRIGNAATTAKPTETKPPVVNGSPQEGKTLTADPGDWTGTAPITFNYQWQRCDQTGASCQNIGSETARTYDIRSQDKGNTLRIHVVAKNADGNTADTSAPSAVVTAAVTTPIAPATGCPSGTGPIDIAGLTAPARLLIDGQQVSPSPIGRSPGDLTMKFHVSACNGRAVTGALVYAAAVPFNQFSVAAEQQTGSDGWATLTEHQGGAYPASSRQQLLAVFVRARKPGDPILGGISSSRLVSFPVNLHQ